MTMPAWRLAHSLEVLRSEIDTRWPNRSRASDGTIGDAAHASEGDKSDHNPWVHDANGEGVVRAFDATADGIDTDGLAEHLRQLGAHNDPRMIDHGYVIWNRRIASEQDGWAWRQYTGDDPHTSHVHVSVCRNASYDSGAAWGISSTPTTTTTEDDAVRAIQVQDWTPGARGSWWVRTVDGSVYTDGAPYLGGLNNHPDWHAGTQATPVVGAAPWRDDGGQCGYVIVTEDATGLHFYHFDRKGTFAK